MLRDEVLNSYFDWMYDTVCRNRFADSISYRKLLSYLHGVSFRYSVRKDVNRVADGIALRRRFSHALGYDDLQDYLREPCSVLEMMVALAVRCEEDIMDDPGRGNRTAQWFWGMINNLGLGGMTDSNFDERYIDNVVKRFLDRRYEPNGKGGLFTVRHCEKDLRRVEIWVQLLWYLDSIT